MAASTLNYTIGKGVVSLSDNGTTWVDMGNCPSFEITPTITKLDHFSSREGTKKKDKSVVTEKGGTCKIKFDEITLENLQLALLTGGSGGADAIFSSDAIEKHVRFVGANDVGNRFTVILNKVSFIPSSAIGFISDGFLEIDITGEILADDTGDFGTITQT